MSWTITEEPDPGPELRKAIGDILVAYNTGAAGDGKYRPLAITVRDQAGTIVGGLWGYSLYEYLFIELLTTGAARGEGVGQEVMALAEAEARRRGCTGIWLDTMTFQAPWFYPKLGFTEFGRLHDHPAGHDRLFLVKRLTP